MQHTGTEAQSPTKVSPSDDHYEQEADHVAASVFSLPDTQTIGADIQSIDSLLIDADNAHTAAPLLQFLTSDLQKPAEIASPNELPAEINSNPNPGKDPMLELIEGMKASLRQIGQ